MDNLRHTFVIGNTELAPPDDINYGARRYVPAPPEGAPTWEELAWAVVEYRNARESPLNETRYTHALFALNILADRLRPLVERTEAHNQRKG